jgi:hypothetical protein
MALDRSFENDRPWWPLLTSQAYALLCRHAGLIWFAGAVVLGIAWCAYTGIDANYDRLNYHLPSASALLQGRIFEDVAISSVQTYFNPVINLFSYVLSRELGFFWSRYALVAVQALAWAFLAAVVWRVVVLELEPKPAHGLVVGAAMAVLSLVAPLSILILGTSLTDLIMATFIGAALLVRLPTGFEARPWRGALTGLILGIGVGLKPTILPICVAYGLVFYAMLAMLTRPARAAAEFAAFGAAAAMATLLAAGPWALAVLKETGNPVFPYANDFFQSPFVPSVPMADNRFLPASLGDWLSVPARLAIGGDKITGESYLRDIRFALFWYALVPALGVCAAWRWRQAVAFCRSAPRTCFLYAFFIAAWLAWEATTGIHRYALMLDILVGFLLPLPLLLVPYRWACIGAAVMVALHVGTVRSAGWGVRQHVAFDQSSAPGAGKILAQDALVFTSRKSLLDPPKGYLIDYFGPESRLVMRSRFEPGLALDTSADGPFAQKVRTLLGRRWQSGVWYVTDVAPDAGAYTYFSAYGLKLTSDCTTVTTWAAPRLVMCRLLQAGAP